MKTTVEIADALLDEAKAIAVRDKVTLRTLIENGLRTVIERDREPKPPFKLRDASWGHGGMVKDFTWDEIMDIIYEGRGGNPEPTDDRG
ncbi:MAG: hypothetical protein ACRD01_09105 [Terriglobales bacterium]